MKNWFIIVCACTIMSMLISCKTIKSTSIDDDLSTLQYLMAGTFDSSEQAAQDSSYYNITLNHTPIWTDKAGHWLYVEQAVTSNLSKPYRQRIYKITKAGNTFVSTIYTLLEPERFINKNVDPNFFDSFDQSLLIEREGCDVYLEQGTNQSYEGETKHGECSSSLRGAAFATSKVAIHKDRIVSWDQGFDTEGKQVWGAEKGGYIFIRK